MSASKDKKTDRWMVQLRIMGNGGKIIHKKKRGFLTKRAAQDWESEIRLKRSADMNMPFEYFLEIYLEDLAPRIKESTLITKKYIIYDKILPEFAKCKMQDIKATDVRKWQNKMMSQKDRFGKKYSQTYLRTIQNQLTAIFNYAVKYYNLTENPCHKAGLMGKKHADEMQFWTKNEFQTFIETKKQNILHYTAFMMLYYTGIRIGELCALTINDIDLEKRTISIKKSLQRINTAPKTPKSKRVITIPRILTECLDQYLSCNEFKECDQIFRVSKYSMSRQMISGCKVCGVKRIRVHDYRHSHASLLIELGFNILLVSQMLGHEKVSTTLDTYGHLYPNKQKDARDMLDSINMA